LLLFSDSEIASFKTREQVCEKFHVLYRTWTLPYILVCVNGVWRYLESGRDYRKVCALILFFIMKKIFTLIFLSILSFNVIHAEITWTLSDDGILTISGTDIPNYYYANVPWYSQQDKIKKVIIEDGVTNLGDCTFYDCFNLTTITLPNSVTRIGDDTFKGCSSLTSITIPDFVTSIGGSAFEGCSSLTSITIPNSVTKIGNYAFYGVKLRTIVVKAKTVPSIDMYSFSDQSYYHTTLIIPEGCWNKYVYDNKYWYKFINIREMAYNEANLTNSKAYMMKSANEGSYLFYDSVNDCVGELNENALDDTEENNTWMTVEVEGKHYVYNLGAKKFLVSGKANTGYSLSDIPVSIDIEDGKDAIVFGKGKEFYMVINDKLNVLENLESQIATTTGIKEISADANQPTIIYNVNGQIISDNAKGLYIKNGKKYIK